MKRCGITLLRDTLRANRETKVLSMVERGPYGRVEDFNGEIVFEVGVSCSMSNEMQEQVACAMAADLIEQSVVVTAWQIAHIGERITLIPARWEEIEPKTGFLRLMGWAILLAPSVLMGF